MYLLIGKNICLIKRKCKKTETSAFISLKPKLFFAYDATIVSLKTSYIYYSLPNYNQLNQCTNY